MLRLLVGQSDEVIAEEALEQAVEQCRRQLGDARPGAWVLFTSLPDADYDAMASSLADAFGEEVPVAGCTTDGEMACLGYGEETVALGLFTADAVTFSSGFGGGLGTDPQAAVNAALDEALDALSQPPRLCVLLPDGLCGGGPSALEHAMDRLGPEVTVVGGTAGDCFGQGRTWQFGAGRAESEAVSLLLMGGPLRCSVGMDSGWRPVGPEVEVGRAEQNVVWRIGEKSALDFYRYWLGDVLHHVSPFALLEMRRGEGLLRAPLSFDESDGSMHFAAPVASGTRVRMTELERNAISAAAKSSVDTALMRFGGRPEAALAFSCTFRRQMLGTRSPEEMAHLDQSLPSDVSCLGFYTYGEMAPPGGRGPAVFNNCSFVTLLLGEEVSS